MKQYDINRLRNIGIMAHIDAGKTTTTERILYYTGLTHKMGEVHDSNTVMDWMAQEQERGITITSAATTCFWKDYHFNIIDTPGHVDFTVEVERCLRILDGAIFLLDAKEGVEAQTKIVWQQAAHYEVPRLIFINKMDTIGADFHRSIQTVKAELDGHSIPIQIPIGCEKEFSGVISLITMKAYYNVGEYGEKIQIADIPSDYLDTALSHRQSLIESLAEIDDNIMLLYLESKEIPSKLMKKALRTATIGHKLTPVLCGSAFTNKGIQFLLDAIIDYLPSPNDCPLVEGTDNSGSPIFRKPSASEPFSGLIFKVMSDPYVGRLAYLRVYSGTIKTGSTLLNVSRQKKVRTNKLLRMHANKRTEIDEAHAGDIVAAIGLKYAGTGNTLADLSHPILYESIEFPKPVISRALEAKKPSEYDKMREAIAQLAEEDPTLITYVNKETGQTIISGMGELHLEIVLDRLEREFGITVNSGKPQVTYKESILNPVTVDYELKHLGTQSVYAYIKLKVSPNQRGVGHTLSVSAEHKKIPQNYISSALEGINQSLLSGIISGYEVIDLDVDVCEISYLENLSSDVAYKTAAANAITKALKEGKAVLLEPIFVLNIMAPESYIGDVMEDLKRRKGNITAIEMLPRNHKVIATVPLSQLFGYASDVRSITRGNGHYTLVFSHYDMVDSNI